MRKSIRTTVIAFSLVLAMIGGLLPGAVFQAAAQEIGISGFQNTQVRALQYLGTEASVTYNFWNGITSQEDITLLTDYNEGKNTNWAYHSNYGGSPNNTLIGYYGALRFSSNQTSNNAWVAFKVQSPEAGKYTADFTYMCHVGVLSAEMYMLPGDTADIAAALQTATPFGEVTFVQDSSKTLQRATLGTVEIPEKGEYLFVMKAKEISDSTSGAGRTGMHITTLTLDGTDPNLPELAYPGAEASVTYDFVTGLASSAEDVTLLTDYDAEKNTNWAYHSNLNVSSIKTYWGTLRLGGSKPLDTWAAFKIKSPVAGKYTASMDYKYHAGCISMETYLLPGNTADIATALVSAKPFGTITYIQDAVDKTMKTVELGTVDIPAEGEYLFVMKVKERNTDSTGAGVAGMHIAALKLDGTDPNPPELAYPGAEASATYDFVTGLASSAEDVTLLTDYDAEKNTNWAYHSNLNVSSIKTYWGTLRMGGSTKLDTWAAFKIQSPVMGKYTASMDYKYHAGCISAETYLLPGDTEDIATALESAKPFGTITYIQDAVDKTMKTVKLGAVDIPAAGEYLFVMKVKEQNTNSAGAGVAGMHIAALKLDGSELDRAELTLDKDSAYVGESAQASVKAYRSDDSEIDLSALGSGDSITYTSSATEVAEINETTGVITAKKAGETTISALLNIGGVEKTVSAPFTVGEKIFAGWYADAEFTTPLRAGAETSGAYKKSVDAKVLDVKAQITADTTAESEQASLRIVSTVDSLNYQEAGFYIQIEGAEKVNKIPCNTVFTRIVAAENGVAFDYQPSIFSSDSTYFMTYTINNIPNANFGTNISVTPYWITLDGTEVKGATSVKNVNMGISGT